MAEEKTKLDQLLEDYRNRIIPELMKEFNYGNRMQVPKIEKVTLNMGIGEASRDTKQLDGLRDNLAVIAGQQPVITRAKKSIANFKLREGMPVGCSVTLRRNRMYEFMDRFINICIPRIRDFRCAEQFIRWPWQLLNGHTRTIDFS